MEEIKRLVRNKLSVSTMLLQIAVGLSNEKEQKIRENEINKLKEILKILK